MEVVKNENSENNNFPVKKENGLTTTNGENVEEESSFMDTAKQAALMSFVEGILPKIKPFINPAVKKLEEYFGDDEKVFLIRRTKGKAARVIVLDNNKGSYLISNERFDVSNPEYSPKSGETDEDHTKRLINEAVEKAKADLTTKIENIKNRKHLAEVNHRKHSFEADEVSVINVHSTDVFIEKLMSGEFTTQR